MWTSTSNIYLKGHFVRKLLSWHTNTHMTDISTWTTHFISISMKSNKTIVDSRLRSAAAALVNHFEYTPLAASPLLGRLWASMTSSTKSKTHNVLHCRQSRTKSQPRLTDTEFREVWMCGLWDMRADRHRDRQTYRHAYRNTSHPYRGQSNKLTNCNRA